MLQTASLREQVKEYLQQQMINGDISFGERISMPRLSKDLGVSITPIREALTQLYQANIIKAIPNRGFFLPELNKQEAMEIYPIIASLEYLAVTESRYSKNEIEELKKIQTKIMASSDPVKIIKLDLEFHDVLLQNFANSTLKKILNDLKIRVFLYELNYMKVPELTEKSSDYHLKIITSLVESDNKSAAKYVRENWLSSIGFINEVFNKNQE